MPGTGKTATVTGVIKKLKEEKNLDFQFVPVNAMKLNHPNDIFSEIVYQLDLKHKKNSPIVTGSAVTSVDLLDSFFSSQRKPTAGGSEWVVMLLDEIDYLVTKSQTVCYKLFDWPSFANSRLIVIAISNTMDLPERLIPRVASRLGMARLNFLTYNAEQIWRVIMQRLEDADAVDLFDDSAIQLCSMKVAVSSGDLRKALHILRRAMELRAGDVVTVS